MFRRRKTNQKQYILIAADNNGVRQRAFSPRQLFTFAVLLIIALGTAFFFSAGKLTNLLYQAKLEQIKAHYSILSTTLADVQTRVSDMSVSMAEIEEKDAVLRAYADMPQIDRDIRELGIGGTRLANNINLNDGLSDRILSLEMDVQTLSRKVKLELNSYAEIYDKVNDNISLLHSIPSIRPLEGGYLNSDFGYRRDPYTGKVRFHYGQDITVRSGEPIYAPANGVIKEARTMGEYGKVIKINHGYGYVTLYAHLSSYAVETGQEIQRSDLIGYSGNTGRSTAPHLHYEVHRFGTPQDPLDYFFGGYLH